MIGPLRRFEAPRHLQIAKKKRNQKFCILTNSYEENRFPILPSRRSGDSMSYGDKSLNGQTNATGAFKVSNKNSAQKQSSKPTLWTIKWLWSVMLQSRKWTGFSHKKYFQWSKFRGSHHHLSTTTSSKNKSFWQSCLWSHDWNNFLEGGQTYSTKRSQIVAVQIFSLNEVIPKTPSARKTRWAIALMRLYLKFEYVPLEQTQYEDALSWLRFDEVPEQEKICFFK